VAINGFAQVTSNSCSMTKPCSISQCIYPLQHSPTQNTCIQHSYDCREQCYSISLHSHKLLECINLLIVVTQFLIRIIALMAWCEQRTLHDCSTKKTCCWVVNHWRTNSSHARIHTEKSGIAKVCLISVNNACLAALHLRHTICPDP